VIDSHCHLDSERFAEDQAEVIERAFAAGVERMMCIGTGDGPPDIEGAVRIADRYEKIYATVGVHPHDASKYDDGVGSRLAELLKHRKVLALGEIGLDYHYDHSPRDIQQAAFIDQMRIAADARMPIVIHTREAWDDTFALIEQHWKPTGLGGIMHCFSGGPAEAQRSLDLGFHLSFSGIVTFPKSVDIQAAAYLCPDDRLLIETDAPFLAPAPHRGKRNEPAFVAHTAAKLAELRSVPVTEIVRVTTANFRSLTSLPVES
jgi:TatD DNase family protein